MQEEKPFKQISSIEYEIQANGRTKAIRVPFAKVEKVFAAFISNGGIIDPETGQVQTDIITLVASFKDVGNVLLTEYDEVGRVVEEGSCASLSTKEVIALFQLATEVVENFIRELSLLQKPTAQTVEKSESQEATTTA